jgi:hypothetical protein
MLLRNTSDLGDVHYGQEQRFVAAGDTVEATGEEAKRMLEGGHFSKVDPPAKQETTSSKESG